MENDKDLQLLVHCSEGCTSWVGAKLEPGARNTWASHVGGRDTGTWAITHSSPRCISRDNDQKWNSKDSNWHCSMGG